MTLPGNDPEVHDNHLRKTYVFDFQLTLEDMESLDGLKNISYFEDTVNGVFHCRRCGAGEWRDSTYSRPQRAAFSSLFFQESCWKSFFLQALRPPFHCHSSVPLVLTLLTFQDPPIHNSNILCICPSLSLPYSWIYIKPG